jgi:hypothetical protein
MANPDVAALVARVNKHLGFFRGKDVPPVYKDLAALLDVVEAQGQALATLTDLLREATGWAQSSWREDADPIHAAELHRRLDGFLSRARAALAERPQ